MTESTSGIINEEILTDTGNRFVLFPIKYPEIFKMYKTASSAFWQVEEVDLSKDIDDWENKLNDNERNYIEQVLAYFAASDGLVDENLITRFYSDVKIPEARAFYTFQMAMESVHCVSADTVILTDHGYKRIKDLENKKVNVWNGDEFSATEVKFTGNSSLYKVVLTNGMELDCTDEHKWYINTDNNKNIKFTKDLKMNDVIFNYDYPVVDNPDPDYFQNPYMHGIFCGNGSICNGHPVITLYGDKKKLIEYLPKVDYKFYDEQDKIAFYATKYINKDRFTVPINHSINTKIKWFEGVCDIDGYINFNANKDISNIQISSNNFRFLKDIQLLLSTLDIHSNIKISHENNIDNDYDSQESYILFITFDNLLNLVNRGFNPKLLVIKLDKNTTENPSLIEIKSIEKLESIHPTYCFNEPLKHSGIFNGILTGQSEMYSLMIDTFIKDSIKKDKLFNGMTTIPAIKKKAEWTIKWMENEDLPFSVRLVAFAIVEGVFFSSAFASIYWLKERNLMPGLCASNVLISKDESLHTEFAILLYSTLKHRVDEKTIHEIMKEAIDIEIEFVTESIPCSLLGMNNDLMSEYVRYVGDRLLVQLGYSKLYEAKNSFPFMDRINLESKSNFFEERNLEYSKSNIGKKDIYKFSMDADF